jgi:hypothetical protein
MVIASRTPEGDPNRCPVCGNALKLEPSIDTRDGPCPHCGHLLWFTKEASNLRPSHAQTGELVQMVLRIGTMRFGPPPPPIEAAIREIPDPERLASVIEKATTAVNWDELLASG